MLNPGLHLARLPSCLTSLLLAASLIAGSPPAPVAAQAQPRPTLEASRHNLSYGRYDGLRIEGLAGTTYDLRQGKFYRNMPGISGPSGLFAVIAGLPNPGQISFYSPPPVGPNVTAAGQWLPPGFSLVVLETGGRFAYDPDAFMRFGEGNFYATVAIPGTGIVPGMELYTREHFAAYTANSVLWEAPDIGNIVLETTISGGTVDVGSILTGGAPPIGSVIIGGTAYGRGLGYADPLEVNIEIQRQRELPDGTCRVRMRAALSPTFGNAVSGALQETYTWFRWAIEDNDTLITDVAGTDIFTVDLPLVPGSDAPDMVSVTVVASSFGPGLLLPQPFLPPPPVTVGTNPFITPAGGDVGLDTFLSFASALGDTETISRAACEKQPLRITKEADPGKVPGEGGDVTYRVTIRNMSDKDDVTVTTLTDDRLGDISASCAPPLPVTLRPGGFIDCRVTVRVTGPAETTLTNIVRATGGYADDGTPVEASASADVEIGPAAASCNSAVESGGDTGGGVTVDLGDFVGKAGFTWEMYDIKDQMNVTVGGIQRTTGCVSGSGTFEIDVLPGAGTARVEVVPNCEGTTGTAWNFVFECPLRSAVTADGSGSDLSSTPGAGSGAGAQAGPTGWGAPITPPPLSPARIGPTGQQVAESAPNESIATASPVNAGDTFTGTISTTGDVDHVALDLPSAGELTVVFRSVPAELDMAFRVIDADGRQIHGWQGAPAPGQSYETAVDIGVPGRYILEVRDGFNNASSSGAYTLVTSFLPTADTAEPNDSIATATPLDWNRTVAANILPIGDVDHYAVAAPKQGQLTVSFLAAPAALDMAFRVLDAQGRQVHGWQAAPQPGAAFTGHVDLPASGTYLVEVRDGNNNARDAAPYQIVVAFDPTADAAEPNDSIGTATPIAPNQRIDANILPIGDVDHYRIDLARQGELTVEFPFSPPNVDMAFRVLDADGRQIHGWQGAPAPGQPFTARVDIPASGPHVIEVRDGNNNARSERAYAMVTSFLPSADTAEPNDSIATATPLDWNRTVAANILPIGDVDHYAVAAPKQGQLTVSFPAAPAALDMAFRVLDAQGRQVHGWQGAPQPGAAFTGQVDLPAPGTYLVEVRDGNNNARDAAPYQIVVAFDPTADAAEPNDSIGTATPIAPNQRIDANILPIGDVDHYGFSAAAAATLRVTFHASPPTLDMAFRLLAVDGRQVAGWQSAPQPGAGFAGTVPIQGAGDYIIEVRDRDNNARAPAPYSFSLSFE